MNFEVIYLEGYLYDWNCWYILKYPSSIVYFQRNYVHTTLIGESLWKLIACVYLSADLKLLFSRKKSVQLLCLVLSFEAEIPDGIIFVYSLCPRNFLIFLLCRICTKNLFLYMICMIFLFIYSLSTLLLRIMMNPYSFHHYHGIFTYYDCHRSIYF